jgi:hypothetical protein
VDLHGEIRMATNATWSVIFDDKTIVKQAGDAAGTFYVIDDDDTFWNQSKFSNIWAVQYGTSVTSDEVEYRDTTPHSSWDDNNVEGETSEEKIERLGARPTSYSS